MAKSRTRAKADKAEIVGRRNLIINGAMQVWQRGTSFDVTGDTCTADRWKGRDAVLSQSTDVPANEGFRYSAFYDNDGTRPSINFRQIVEDGKLYTDNKEITLSFWVKGSVASSGCTVDFGDQQYTSFPLTTEWNRVTLTVPSYVRNTSNLLNGGLYIDWNFGTDYPDVYITGVQLELGPVATDFEHRSYGEELALCQRYYYRWTADSGSNTFVLVGMRYSNGNGYGVFHLPVIMRAIPSCSAPNNFQELYPATAVTKSLSVLGTNQQTIRCLWSSSASTGQATTIRGLDTNSYFDADAEL